MMMASVRTLRNAIKKPPLSFLLYKPYVYLNRSYLMPQHILTRSYYGPRFSNPIWSHVFNRKAREQYRRHPIELNARQQPVLHDLQANGICTFPLEDLSGRQLDEYVRQGEALLEDPLNRAKVANAETLIRHGGAAGQKYYLVSLWEKPVLDLNNPFVKLILSDGILGIVAGYLGMLPRLHYADVWYNLPMGGLAIASQQWHRDPEDRKVVKLFLYLRDVDEGTGPFWYIPGTHVDGPYGSVFPRKVPYGVYPPRQVVEDMFPDARRRACTGRAGTIIICDTVGIHRGGHAATRPRLLLNVTYTTDAISPISRRARNWTLPPDIPAELSPVARYALGIE